MLLRHFLCINVVVLLLANLAQGASYIWNGTSGNWTDSTRWSPNGIPGATDTATINSGVVSVSADTTVGTLNFNGGTINGVGPLRIATQMSWTAGNREGPGVTAIGTGAVLNLSGASVKGFYYHTLQNEGTINWDGSGNWGGHSGPILSNLVGGVVNLLSDSSLTRFNSGAQIYNAGTIRKSGGSGTQTLEASLVNTGTLEISTGVLSLTGSYSPAANSTNRFAIGGYAAGTGFGRLAATGALTVAGQLELVRSNNFSPTNGATFAIMMAGSRNGTFSTVTGRGIGGGCTSAPAISPAT